MDAEIAIAISENSCPASSLIKSIGVNTSTVVRVDASTALQTWRTPARDAANRSRPWRRYLSILSNTTIELSSVIPIAKAMPAREITLILRPAKKRPINAAMVHIGIPTTPTRVAEKDLKNNHMTRLASKAPIVRFLHTFDMDALT